MPSRKAIPVQKNPTLPLFFNKEITGLAGRAKHKQRNTSICEKQAMLGGGKSN